MRRLLIAWLLLAAACAVRPTIDQPRRLDAPVQSAGRLVGLFLGPQALARDCRRFATRATGLAAAELEPIQGVPRALSSAVAVETGRIQHVPATLKTGAASAAQRLGALAAAPPAMLRALSAALADLGPALHEVPQWLLLDYRPLEEPDDLRHRTDPADDHPEASVLSRLLRRILP